MKSANNDVIPRGVIYLLIRDDRADSKRGIIMHHDEKRTPSHKAIKTMKKTMMEDTTASYDDKIAMIMAVGDATMEEASRTLAEWNAVATLIVPWLCYTIRHRRQL
jgi:hypothetical protein